jgi:hypothetical protein
MNVINDEHLLLSPQTKIDISKVSSKNRDDLSGFGCRLENGRGEKGLVDICRLRNWTRQEGLLFRNKKSEYGVL